MRIAEVDYDPKANYQLGHVPGAVLFYWKDINDPVISHVLVNLKSILGSKGFKDI